MHVVEKVEFIPPEKLHPTQGASPVLKLVSQPPLQLLLAFSSLATLPNTESGAADGVLAVGDLRRDASVLATCFGLCVLATCFGLCGLATCVGASTVMLGSGAGPVAVCDTAVPLEPQSNAVDTIAMAEGAAKLEDNLMTYPPKSGRERRPGKRLMISSHFSRFASHSSSPLHWSMLPPVN